MLWLLARQITDLEKLGKAGGWGKKTPPKKMSKSKEEETLSENQVTSFFSDIKP